MKNTNPIDSIFDNLDMWRNFPAYQLERRADIFFSIYLPEILQYRYGYEIDGVVPEFPIRIGTIVNEKDWNQSFKVDYLAKSNIGKSILLIELKTDGGSRRDRQDWYLERAKQAGMTALLEGVRKIYQATNKKKKYQFLLGKLQEMGLIMLDQGGGMTIPRIEYDIQIVYIQPNNPDGQNNIITFQDVAEVIEKHGDELSIRFSKSLLKWAGTIAGER